MKKNIMSLATVGLVSLAVAATAFASPATVERSVNFRSAPSTSSKVYQNLKPGTSIEVLSQVNAYWLKVKVNGKEGYLSPNYITYDSHDSHNPGDSNASVTKEAVTSGYVNFRSGPSTSSKVKRNLKPGTPVRVLEEVNAYWLKVEVGGQEGYLSPNYITYASDNTDGSDDSDDSDDSNETVTQGAVTSGYVNFRSGPSTSSKVQQNLKPGTPVRVLEEVNAYWLKVEVGGKTGYLSPKYITYTGGQQPSPSPAPSPSPTPDPAPAPSAVAARIIQHAKDLEGITHYAYGVNQAPKLLDCSAMVKYVFGLEGIKLKWGTRYLKDSGTYVPRGELKAGDLVLLRVGSSSSIGHVGIYMGNGQMIHNSPSADGIEISSIETGYWSSRYVTARRVI